MVYQAWEVATEFLRPKDISDPNALKTYSEPSNDGQRDELIEVSRSSDYTGCVRRSESSEETTRNA